MNAALAMRCVCGHYAEVVDEDDLARVLRVHLDREHPEIAVDVDDDELRAIIGACAYVAIGGEAAPPFAGGVRG